MHGHRVLLDHSNNTGRKSATVDRHQTLMELP